MAKSKRLSEKTRKLVYLDTLDESFTTPEICEKYGITKTTIYNIKRMYKKNDELEEEEEENDNVSVVSQLSKRSDVSHISRKSKTIYENTEYDYLPKYGDKKKEILEQEAVPEYEISDTKSIQADMLINQMMDIDLPPTPRLKVKEQIKQPLTAENKVVGIYNQSEGKQASIAKINAYLTTFPAKLSDMCDGNIERFKNNLNNLTPEEVDGILGAMKFRISQSGLNDSVFLGFQTGCRAVENIGTHVGLKLQGLTEAMVANQSVKDCIDEMGISYLSSYAISPEKRLIGLFCMNVYSIHTKNTLDSQMTDVLNDKVNPNDEKLADYKEL